MIQLFIFIRFDFQYDAKYLSKITKYIQYEFIATYNVHALETQPLSMQSKLRGSRLLIHIK